MGLLDKLWNGNLRPRNPDAEKLPDPIRDELRRIGVAVNEFSELEQIKIFAKALVEGGAERVDVNAWQAGPLALAIREATSEHVFGGGSADRATRAFFFYTRIAGFGNSDTGKAFSLMVAEQTERGDYARRMAANDR